MKLLIYSFVLMAGMVFPQQGYSKSVSLPEIRVPHITIDGNRVPYVLIQPTCQREATFWEQLNNGLDPATNCDEFSYTPTQNRREGILLRFQNDGSLNVPAIQINYRGGKLFKDVYLCVEVVAVARISQFYDGSLYPSPASVKERIRFCADVKAPKVHNTGYHSLYLYPLSTMQDILSAGIRFSAHK